MAYQALLAHQALMALLAHQAPLTHQALLTAQSLGRLPRSDGSGMGVPKLGGLGRAVLTPPLRRRMACGLAWAPLCQALLTAQSPGCFPHSDGSGMGVPKLGGLPPSGCGARLDRRVSSGLAVAPSLMSASSRHQTPSSTQALSSSAHSTSSISAVPAPAGTIG